MKILPSRRITEKISRRALVLIQIYATTIGPEKPHKWNVSMLQDYARRGRAGIVNIPKYLFYQEKGFKPFIIGEGNRHKGYNSLTPYNSQGDITSTTVPLSGTFRKVVGPGLPGFVTIRDEKVWRPRKWEHPGLEPKNFMQNAFNQAIKENQRELVEDYKEQLRKENNGR
jgi:hypothetical protein